MKWISCEKDGCFDVCLVKGGAAGRVHTGGIVEGSALGSPTTKDHVVLCMSLHSYVQNTYSLMMENHWTKWIRNEQSPFQSHLRGGSQGT